LHLVGILFPHINDDAGQNHIKFHVVSLGWFNQKGWHLTVM